jgi:diguanylate cyclase (GGDEF)-like protein
MGEHNKLTESVESLRALKRRIYFWAATVGLLAILAGWIFKSYSATATPYDQIIFPILTVMCLSLLIVLWRIPTAMVWVELSLFVGTAFSLLGRLFEILFTPETPLNPDHLADFSDLLYWFPLVYVLAFLMFESRRRLLVGSLVFFAASAILGLAHVIPEWLWEGETADLYVLGRFYLANAAYIVLLMVSVRLNEQYVRVRTLAETMTRLAHTDTLTQIANRRELDETIAREVNRATRYHQPLSVIMFDLDHFKQVNDTYGHETGDTVLRESARVVQGLLRLPDLLGRWGGEEFLIVAPQTDCAQASELAERLRQAIAACRLDHIGGITASFGVAQYQPQESPEAWLKRADEALYAAKQGGRDQVATSTPTSS